MSAAECAQNGCVYQIQPVHYLFGDPLYDSVKYAYVITLFLLMGMRNQPFQRPSAKKGVIYAIMKPRPFKIAQVIMMRLSHARDSSTVLPDFEKFISSRATAAVTTAAMVEINRI